MSLAVAWGLEHRDLERIWAIGVDEVLWHRGHQYLRVVYQIDAHCCRLPWSEEDRTKTCFEGFFDWFGLRAGGSGSSAPPRAGYRAVVLGHGAMVPQDGGRARGRHETSRGGPARRPERTTYLQAENWARLVGSGLRWSLTRHGTRGNGDGSEYKLALAPPMTSLPGSRELRCKTKEERFASSS